MLNRLLEKEKALEVFNRLTDKQAFEVEPLQLIELLSGMINCEKNPAFDCRRAWNKQTWLSKQIGNPGTAIKVSRDGLLFNVIKVNTFSKRMKRSTIPTNGL